MRAPSKKTVEGDGGSGAGGNDGEQDEEEEEKEDEEKEVEVKIGKKVHIPRSVFPEHKPPKCGYWVGKTCATKKGGKGDVGIHIDGEDIFSRPKAEVAAWLVEG